MKKLIGFIRNNQAVTAIEFAIIAPLFFLIFMGIIEVGLTMFVDSTMNTALRSAARKGIPEGYANVQLMRNEMQGYMSGIYADAPRMTISVTSIPPAEIGDDGRISLNDAENELAELEAISAQFLEDPAALFGNQDSFSTSIDEQSGAITIYAAQYEWGGFTGIVGAFLPEYLYAVSIVRNEVFEQ